MGDAADRHHGDVHGRNHRLQPLQTDDDRLRLGGGGEDGAGPTYVAPAAAADRARSGYRAETPTIIDAGARRTTSR